MATATTGAATPRLHALTSLRFVAAALIVVHHGERVFRIGSAVDRVAVLDQAVSFFFVLSGFILAYVYPSLGPGDARRFAVARFARLWPLHAATFALAFLLSPSVAATATVPAALANLALVHAWFPSGRFYFSFNGPSWSISTEAAFYALFPWLVRDFARTWGWKLALSLAATGATIVACAAVLPWLPTAWVLPYIFPAGRVFEFVLGMTAALAWRRLAGRPGPGTAAATALEVAALAASALVMWRTNAWLAAVPAFAWGPIGNVTGIWMHSAGASCLPFAVLVVVMARGGGLVSRALAWRGCVRLGEISYAVYLLHFPLLQWYADRRDALAAIPPAVAYVAWWAALLVAAELTWRFLEMPCRRAIVRRLATPRGALA
jgi:peptidoglycan/LPS O-acetylase OafA/YrhL